ncbi:MAG: hypothetical protein OEY34_08245 [Cyclobacteriaceae bacterium]|nr:hypothetical protein [Cyclobacteriaceae bacterium]
MNLEEHQRDALREIVNIGVGKGAALLAEMMGLSVKLNVPEIDILSFSEVPKYFNTIHDDEVFSVSLNFQGKYKGLSQIIFPKKSGKKLAKIISGDTSDSNNHALVIEILNEVGNIVLNGVMGSFANILKTPLNYDTPSSFEGEINQLSKILTTNWSFDKALICKANFDISSDERVTGDIIILSDRIIETVEGFLSQST